MSNQNRKYPRRQKQIEGTTLTKQAFKDQTNVNNILKKHAVNQTQLPALIQSNPTFGTFGAPQSLLEAYDTVKKAETQFSALPARVREKFQNDPAQFLAFAQDPSKRGDLQKLVNGEPPPGTHAHLKPIVNTEALPAAQPLAKPT